MAKDRKYIVGVNRTGYPEKRNIIDPMPRGFEAIQKKGFRKIRDYTFFKLTKRLSPDLHNVHSDKGERKPDLYHFFNTVSRSNIPWIATFEYDLPRHLSHELKYVNLLSNDSCKYLLALSENTKNVQSQIMQSYPDLFDSVMSKVQVLHPPQRIMWNSNSKPFDNGLKFVFVGNDFFRKGGLELLTAWQALKLENCTLTVVSSFSASGWLDKEVGGQQRDTVERIIAAHDNIIVKSNLPNEQVLEILKESHVAIFPSFGETYGYFVLEAQACGCPVITPNSWAFPEINDDMCGWLMNLPTCEVKGGVRGFEGEPSDEYRDEMKAALTTIIRSIVDDPSQIESKRTAALERIKKFHDPVDFSDRIEAYYKSALNL